MNKLLTIEKSLRSQDIESNDSKDVKDEDFAAKLKQQSEEKKNEFLRAMARNSKYVIEDIDAHDAAKR